MLYTILFSLLFIVISHVLYKWSRDYLTPPKTKDLYTFNSEKVSELIQMLKQESVDFSAMEGELATLIKNENDIEPAAHDI